MPNMSYFRGDDFRQDYAKLGMPCATFPNVPVIAMTATANKLGREHIKESLALQNCFDLIGNPDRTNIYYEKVFRLGQYILMPSRKFADQLPPVYSI
jgi:superfamily II DNA helicase RecQ